MKSFLFISSHVTLLSSLKVCDLHHGKTYVFRVRAVNASGVGRPSDTSEPVLVEARPGETRLLSWQQAGPLGGVTRRRGQTGVWVGGWRDCRERRCVDSCGKGCIQRHTTCPDTPGGEVRVRSSRGGGCLYWQRQNSRQAVAVVF